MPRPAADAAALRHAETWIFDLDNTLYPASINLFAQVDVRIRDYIAGFLGIDADEAYRLQKQYFRDHGTSLSGMMERHAMDPAPFLDYVHDIDLTTVDESPVLDAALTALAGRKVVFTNGTEAHAARIMARLGVEDHFDAVFDIADAGFIPKPDPGAYGRLVTTLGIAPERAVMVEDIARNLVPAAALGMATVWLRSSAEWAGSGDEDMPIDHVVDDLPTWLARVAGVD